MAHRKLDVIVHQAEEGGYWGEVPAIPGCATQGETFEELVGHLNDAVAGCLSVGIADFGPSGSEPPQETAV
jgi:predicted RNase H-like HicB family nuclease